MIEFRIEAVNLFNHVNLGNPDSEVGVPGNNNTNAGRINSTAFFNADPQRNFQFAAAIYVLTAKRQDLSAPLRRTHLRSGPQRSRLRAIRRSVWVS